MKIAFLFKRDSHFKAVKSTALRVCAQYNCEPVFIGIDSDFSPGNEAYSVVHIDKKDLTSLYEYDYVIACLGGYLLNQVVFALRDTDTKIISIFPGIVSHYQLDAFISRLNADQVWLNSRADYELYSKICKVLRVKNNGLLYGMSWIDSSLVSNSDKVVIAYNKAIFFEQTEILSNSDKRHEFLKKITDIINSNPEILFIYKIRDNVGDKLFCELRKKVSCLPNVTVVKRLSEQDILESCYYLSISSSALVEGILLNKHSYMIDWTLLDSNAKEFFRHSGIILNSDKLLDITYSVNNKWLSKRVVAPLELIDLKKINQVGVKTVFLSRQRSYNHIRFNLLKLSLRYCGLFSLVLNKGAISSIQKALEYLELKDESK